ncbi:MAG: hypothetical protein U5N85_10000 [Arcicella sp.]|nr:hypothetical protein [Arcicella sp.]
MAVNTVFGLLGAGGSNDNNASREIANLKRTINNSLNSNSSNYNNPNTNNYRGLSSSTNSNSSSNTYKVRLRKPTASSYNNAGSTTSNNTYYSNTTRTVL